MVLAIALSGGVDSAVAAVLLRDKYPRMIGASHVIWPESRCCSAEVLDRARDICRRLGIPYVQEELFDEFRQRVVGDFIRTYLSGRTPNPCVLCNRIIRFDAFYRRLESSLRAGRMLGEREELLFATGHYARIVNSSDGPFIARGIDRLKDQSYMLYQVEKRMLASVVLPLGEYRKSEVLSMAADLQLPFTQVRESQDACFVDDSYVQFIREQTGRSDFLRAGEIIDLEGRVLGRHRGTINYTVGQRRGLGLGNGPWYVTRIDAKANRLVVAGAEQARCTDFTIDRANWFIEAPQHAFSCTVKTRYQIDDSPCTVEPEEGRFRVVLQAPRIVTPGQSAVFYDRDLVLGGGIIR
ncbi:MAG: tRNA 2-thiouridine(34) synthase MnmA [Spirochaetales bacterium]|nr:tRNA 2-thiouridine(34) synthase MnmA [Spirochaetales bacterium]